ncbi:MAG: heat-inducible transcription repressor HrcA [Ruminiclostridium sp.]|nr:heat-inducible transcription repressor HrcA [Ruminiclostridium sp.]MBQ9933715.1 heat-inducible transcription repressor HrcA [Ruminiclostridium sp.]
MELSDRKKQILRAVVENYIQTAEPVGSKAIVASAGLKVSSATIRNEMAELETLGLLEQPHTSAGRIPSPQGYRLYVNELMEEHRLTIQETQKINDALHLKIRQMDQVMSEAGKIISQLTRYPTFALATGSKKAVISRYDLLMVEENAFIAVLMTDGQVVKNKLFRLSEAVSAPQLQLLSTLLNTSFTGLTLEELTPELLKVSAHAGEEAYSLISLVVSFAIEVLEEMENHVVHTAGIPSLLAHPEYQSLEKAEPLMNYLAEMGSDLNLPVVQDKNVKILIGPENLADELKDSSVIMASYDIGGGMQGVIGVVGPTRMDYADLAARLSYFAEGLSRMFGKGEIPAPTEEA